MFNRRMRTGPWLNGQSRGLIIPWLQVRILLGPPERRRSEVYEPMACFLIVTRCHMAQILALPAAQQRKDGIPHMVPRLRACTDGPIAHRCSSQSVRCLFPDDLPRSSTVTPLSPLPATAYPRETVSRTRAAPRSRDGPGQDGPNAMPHGRSVHSPSHNGHPR